MDLVVMHVRTNLGLRPSGVEDLGAVLLDLGLAQRIGARVVEPLHAPPFDDTVDPDFGARNVTAVATLASLQADRVESILRAGGFPIVLGGDDSVLFGCGLALRRLGTTGLVLLDGHTDFWDPLRGSGELSDSDLWLATGRGPPVLADLEGRGPLFEDRSCVVYGHRDRQSQLAGGSDDVYRTTMLVRNLEELRAAGMIDSAHHAIAFLHAANCDRVWLHLDADCIDDDSMPAVDWRLAGGLRPDELVELARPLVAGGHVAGIDITIYNPSLDSSDRRAGQVLVDIVEAVVPS